MIVTELKNLLWKELPNKWGFDRKAAVISRVLEPLEAHIEQCNKEAAELDQAIDQLVTRSETLEAMLIDAEQKIAELTEGQEEDAALLFYLANNPEAGGF